MSSLLVRGGTIATSRGMFRADVLVQAEKVVAIGTSEGWTADQVLDATGCYVMPGGVDVHTHLQHRIDAETMTADDFATGTLAAAFGGTTTIIDFARRQPELGLYDSCLRRMREAEGSAVIDYSFHATIASTGLGPNWEHDMERLVGLGVTSFKLFTAYPGRMMVDDATLLSAMAVARELGCLVLVHAENGHMVAHMTERLVGVGRTEEHWHLLAHPDLAEAEAVHRVVSLADLAGCALYIVHVSSAAAAEEVRRARASGRRIWAETCPQYLFACYEQYENAGFDAAKFICSPPIRRRSNQDGLWRAIQDATIATIATDHAPFRMADDIPELPNQKSRGRGNFSRVPNGVPGIEERLMLMFDGGVRTGLIGLDRFVDLVSTRPAQLFGLYPRKGEIAPGSDADIVVWDPYREHTLSAATHHMHVDYSLYEGRVVGGRPRQVISRGELIVDGDRWLGRPGRGRFIARQAPHSGSLTWEGLKLPELALGDLGE